MYCNGNFAVMKDKGNIFCIQVRTFVVDISSITSKKWHEQMPPIMRRIMRLKRCKIIRHVSIKQIYGF